MKKLDIFVIIIQEELEIIYHLCQNDMKFHILNMVLLIIYLQFNLHLKVFVYLVKLNE